MYKCISNRRNVSLANDIIISCHHIISPILQYWVPHLGFLDNLTIWQSCKLQYVETQVSSCSFLQGVWSSTNVGRWNWDKLRRRQIHEKKKRHGRKISTKVVILTEWFLSSFVCLICLDAFFSSPVLLLIWCLFI